MLLFFPFYLVVKQDFLVMWFDFSQIGNKNIKPLFLASTAEPVPLSPAPRMTMRFSIDYLILSVTIVITASRILTIQKRVTILGSGYPFSENGDAEAT